MPRGRHYSHVLAASTRSAIIRSLVLWSGGSYDYVNVFQTRELSREQHFAPENKPIKMFWGCCHSVVYDSPVVFSLSWPPVLGHLNYYQLSREVSLSLFLSLSSYYYTCWSFHVNRFNCDSPTKRSWLENNGTFIRHYHLICGRCSTYTHYPHRGGPVGDKANKDIPF